MTDNSLLFAPGDSVLDYPRVCSHRGFNTVAPENTLPAFGASVALGAVEIEMDVWPTKDGEIVVCHDPDISRTSNGTGKVMETTLAELRTYDFGSKIGPHWAGLRIATLEETLQKFGRRTIINLHIKSANPGEIYPLDMMAKIVALVHKYGCEDHLYLAGWDDVMAAANQLAPELLRCQLAGGPGKRWEIVEHAIANKAHKLQLFKPCFNQQMIDKAHANNIRCNIFYADVPEEALQYVSMGIDTILTNDYLAVATAVYGSRAASSMARKNG
ncbi:MAG: hypothetical protein IJJ26_04970 [Victivallales bacterium]|nr:hypothetical protein [Victivallales bacterium]